MESPFGSETPDGVVENIEYAKRCLLDSINRGEAPIASHLLIAAHHVLDDQIKTDRSLGMECGWAWIRRADAIVVYRDRGISAGMDLGIARAHEIGIPIEFRTLEGE